MLLTHSYIKCMDISPAIPLPLALNENCLGFDSPLDCDSHAGLDIGIAN